MKQGLNDTTITIKAKYPINFTKSEKRFVLSQYYDGSNSFLFLNAIKPYPLCLANISKDFTIDYNTIDTNDILDIH